MSKRKTHEEFVSQLHDINPDITVIGSYTKAIEPVLCECQICGHKWPGIPNNLLRGEGCGRCARNISRTTSGFVDEIKHVNPSVRVVGEYINLHTRVACECIICGHKWSPYPSSLLKGHSCRKCATKVNSQKRRKTTEHFVEELKEKNPGVVLLDEYIDYKTPIRCKCVCGNDNWYVSPSNLLLGKLCKKCAGSRSTLTKKLRQKPKTENITPRKTDEEFIKEVKAKNPHIEILQPYKGYEKTVMCRCMLCGNVWSPLAGSVLKGICCPECGKMHQTSFPEQAIYYYIQKHFPNSINKYKEGFGRSELDVYIPELHIGIEYDGRKAHKDTEITDNMKYQICKAQGIELIRISELKPDTIGDSYDHLLHSEYGDKKTFTSLNNCIEDLFSLLSLHGDINTKRDKVDIYEQYIVSIVDNSLGTLYPELANEWHYESNGRITPFMIKPKSNKEFYWQCPKCHRVYSASPATRTVGHGCEKCGHKQKKIICIETGETFESASQAKNKTGVCPSSILRCCKGKGNTAGGYHWKYTDNQ